MNAEDSIWLAPDGSVPASAKEPAVCTRHWDTSCRLQRLPWAILSARVKHLLASAGAPWSVVLGRGQQEPVPALAWRIPQICPHQAEVDEARDVRRQRCHMLAGVRPSLRGPVHGSQRIHCVPDPCPGRPASGRCQAEVAETLQGRRESPSGAEPAELPGLHHQPEGKEGSEARRPSVVSISLYLPAFWKWRTAWSSCPVLWQSSPAARCAPGRRSARRLG